MTQMRAALLTTALSLAVSISLCGVLPLWLDEVLQLIETRGTSPAQMLAQLPRNAGAAPLGYLVQQASLGVTGYSAWRARLPSAIFGAAAVFAVACLATELGLKQGWLAGAIFAMLPLTLRYLTESRVYALALLFSILATLAYVRLDKRPSWKLVALYGAALTAAVYTYPYAACVGPAHVAWSVVRARSRAAWVGAAAVAATMLAFLPWYVWSSQRWAAGAVYEALHFSVSWKAPLMLFREMLGAGYWGSGLALILCLRTKLNWRAMSLAVLLIAVPVGAVLSADALFDYFLAARQFLWVLPAVAILLAAAVERGGRTAYVLLTLFVAVCIWKNVRFFTAPREDWQAAADVIFGEVRGGACLVVVDPAQAPLYEFFHPTLSRQRCVASSVVVAATPYSDEAQRRRVVAELAFRGYVMEREFSAGKSRISRFRLTAPGGSAAKCLSVSRP